MLEAVRVPLASLRSRPGAGLTVIVFIFVLLSTTYNVTNPVFEAPDEVWHYLYVRHLAEQHTLPRLDNPSVGSLYQQEAFQAPVYYVTAALLTFWAPRGDLAEITVHNFAGNMGNPGGVGNRNMTLHGPAQQFPYRGEILTVHLVRAVTTLWGVAAVIFTFLAARRVFNTEYLALAAAAAVALTPELLYLSAAVNNDVPVGAMSGLLLWLSIRAAQSKPSWRSAALLGVAAGGVILTKSIATGTVAIPLIAIALSCRSSRAPNRLLVLQTLACIGMIVATTAWWFDLNRQIYGSATPLQSFLRRDDLLGEMPSFGQFVDGLVGLSRSYWAVFGWFNILAPDPYYFYFNVVADLAVLGAIAFLARRVVWRRRHAGAVSTAGVVLALTGALTVTGAVFVYRLIVLAFQGRLLFGAITALACLLVLGWSSLVPRRWGGPFALGLSLTLAIPAAVIPWAVIRPAYAQPPIIGISPFDQARPLNLDFGGEATLLAVETDPRDGSRVRPGDTITVTLYFTANRPIATNYVLFIQLVDPERGAIAKIDTHPGHGALPTSIWRPGQAVIDQYQLKVPTDARGPIVEHVIAGFYREATRARLPTTAPREGASGDAATVMTLVLAGPPEQGQSPVGAVFRTADQPAISLVRFEPAQLNVVAGSTIHGSITYASVSPVGRDYTIFVHLDGPKGPVAQDDRPPRGGAFPTTAWRPGDRVSHDWEMLVPASLPPGEYHLTTGWYEPQTGLRLTTDRGDTVDIGLVRVEIAGAGAPVAR